MFYAKSHNLPFSQQQQKNSASNHKICLAKLGHRYPYFINTRLRKWLNFPDPQSPARNRPKRFQSPRDPSSLVWAKQSDILRHHTERAFTSHLHDFFCAQRWAVVSTSLVCRASSFSFKPSQERWVVSWRLWMACKFGGVQFPYASSEMLLLSI